MTKYIKSGAKKIQGTLRVPGDKSISHRAIMLGSIAEGTTTVSGFLNSADCLSTISCFRKMGIKINQEWDRVTVEGKGLLGLTAPDSPLDVGNSGTTMRLMSGILAGADFTSTITGDSSIQKRPMERIITPLELMGAKVSSQNGCAPLTITPGELSAIDYTLPMASAQVKSCILLAGLYAKGDTKVTEINPSRDHTERMLSAFGADIKKSGKDIILTPGKKLSAMDITVPGDISSAAYFIAMGLIHPNADITIENVNINPTRAGIIQVCRDMGGDITILNERMVCGEEVCDIRVRSSRLKGTTICGDIIPTLIDELPVIAVMGAFAEGTTVIRDAAELRKKESDRIESVTTALSACGCTVAATEDGMEITGGCPIHGAHIDTKNDHRLAMSFSVLGLITGGITLTDPDCVNISFSEFYELVEGLCE